LRREGLSRSAAGLLRVIIEHRGDNSTVPGTLGLGDLLDRGILVKWSERGHDDVGS